MGCIFVDGLRQVDLCRPAPASLPFGLGLDRLNQYSRAKSFADLLGARTSQRVQEVSELAELFLANLYWRIFERGG